MVSDKVILITGGAGSLGQALVKELLKHNPKSIRIFDQSEYALWDMQRHFSEKNIRFLVGDVRDRDRLYRACVGVDIIVHAAALKHVPMCEYNPIEAVKTNILGSINIIDASLDRGVDKVLAISSDKAVHPINLYGATKLTMEKLFTHANVYGDTRFSCVRFGNFKGSIGSVLPLWYKQIEEGKKITVTEKEMTRFWITLDKAAEFVIKCIDMIKGGEIFIPKMPRVELSELINSIAPDAKLEIIGGRAGEKLSELLFNEGESPIDCGDYYLIK